MTADEFYDWSHRPENEGRSWELERGEVVEMPSPGRRHGIVCGSVVRLLGNYLYDRRQGYLCSNDTGVVLERNPDTVRGPDVMVFDRSIAFADAPLKYGDDLPQLIVEVVSPTDQHTKTMKRVSQYLKSGIPLVWVVDPEQRAVAVHHPREIPMVLDENDELTGNGVFPDLRIAVSKLFAVPGQG